MIFDESDVEDRIVNSPIRSRPKNDNENAAQNIDASYCEKHTCFSASENFITISKVIGHRMSALPYNLFAPFNIF